MCSRGRRRERGAVVVTEEDFQRALDANPDDWQTRLVFADWLEEQGDARAEGYRVLGVSRLFPSHWYEGRREVAVVGNQCPYWVHAGFAVGAANYLPGHWFVLIDLYASGTPTGGSCAPAWIVRRDITRRECEDAAALAFAKLPPQRRAELLGGAEVLS